MNERQNPSDLLLRGGTLIAKPCDKCQGVQIKYMNKIICANCGNEIKQGKIDSFESDYVEQPQTEQYKLDIDLKEKIQKRINELISKIGYDKTMSEEAQRIKIIKLYYSLMRKIDS
jgi:uncharacterized Zn finger protein (UPF0148 family)